MMAGRACATRRRFSGVKYLTLFCMLPCTGSAQSKLSWRTAANKSR
jgi:hypothetical protein